MSLTEYSLRNSLRYDEEPDQAPCNPAKVIRGISHWFQLSPAAPSSVRVGWISLSARAVQSASSEQAKWLRRYISLGDSPRLPSSGKAMSPSEREQVHLKKSLPRFLRFSSFSASSISSPHSTISSSTDALRRGGRFTSSASSILPA